MDWTIFLFYLSFFIDLSTFLNDNESMTLADIQTLEKKVKVTLEKIEVRLEKVEEKR